MVAVVADFSATLVEDYLAKTLEEDFLARTVVEACLVRTPEEDSSVKTAVVAFSDRAVVEDCLAATLAEAYWETQVVACLEVTRVGYLETVAVEACLELQGGVFSERQVEEECSAPAKEAFSGMPREGLATPQGCL